jgi:hypothetical protein
MKLRTTVWLQLCLYISLGAGLVSAASPTAAAGDVPAVTRAPQDVNRKLDTPAVPQKDVQTLALAREVSGDVYSSLESFVCNEEVQRFRGAWNGQSATPLDTVTAKLSFERGVEGYSDIQQDKRPRADMSNLPGAWSEGEFGTLLLQTQQLLSTQHVRFDRYEEMQGQPAAVYRFDVASEDSPWDLYVAKREYKVAFRTNVWIAANTGEILKIKRTTLNLAQQTQITEIQWSIQLNHVDLNGKSWLLPASGIYSVSYAGMRDRDWNEISFNRYRKYGAETAIKFE